MATPVEDMGLAAPTAAASTTSQPDSMDSPSNIATPVSSGHPKVQTPSSATSTSHNTSTSKRPPRKSTLTQQQKNQKRQRATQDQLTTLEMEFNKNPTPTANVRERIAEEINMTERSVQIWFQNRYVDLGLRLVACGRKLMLNRINQTCQNQGFGEEESGDWRGLRRHTRVHADILGYAGDGVRQGLGRRFPRPWPDAIRSRWHAHGRRPGWSRQSLYVANR